MASSTGGSGGGGASDDIVEAVKKYVLACALGRPAGLHGACMAQCLALSSRYFFEDSDFEGTFLGWAQAHCDPIDMESEEMKLEYVHLGPSASLLSTC